METDFILCFQICFEEDIYIYIYIFFFIKIINIFTEPIINCNVWRGGRGSAKSAAGERLRRQR